MSFWFGPIYDGTEGSVAPEQYHLWFGKSEDTDNEIRTRFGHLLDPCADGKFDHWCDQHPLGLVALVILMDQFPRNIFRNSARSFAYDWKANVKVWEFMKEDVDDHLEVMERVWLYLVFTHTEDVRTQNKCCQLGREKLGVMSENFRKMWQGIFDKHETVIEQFGRFPHRNKFLQREATADEDRFVNDPKFRFDLPVKLTIDPKTGAAGFNFMMDGPQEPEEPEEPRREEELAKLALCFGATKVNYKTIT